MLKFLESLSEKIRWKVGDKQEFLENLAELYTECIEDCDDILDTLRYYRKDRDNLKSTIGYGSSVSLLDSRTSDTNKLVSKPYGNYREQEPILDHSIWRKQEKRINEHIDFVKNLKREFRDSKKEVENCIENYESEKSQRKAENQLGKNYDINKNRFLPDSMPSEVKERLSSHVDDFVDLEEDNTENDSNDSLMSSLTDDDSTDDQDEDIPIMNRRNLTHFIILYIKNNRDQTYDLPWYRSLKSGHNEHAEKIEETIGTNFIHNTDHVLRRLENIEPELYHLRDQEKEYIRSVLDGEVDHNRTTIDSFMD